MKHSYNVGDSVVLYDKNGIQLSNQPPNFKFVHVLALLAVLFFFLQNKSVPQQYEVTQEEGKQIVKQKYVRSKTPANDLRQFSGKLSKWDDFRLGAYTLAGKLKDNHEIPMDTLRLYDNLMKVFFAESKFKTGKAAINKLSDARGLVQWTKSKRKKLGVPENIHEYPIAEQLRYVFHLFEHEIALHKIDTKTINSFDDVYCIVFAPAYTDAPSSKTMYSSCLKSSKRCKHKNTSKKYCAYHANKGYDLNKDGRIVKSEPAAYVLNKHF